jgi:hypothetical protein
MKFLLGGALVIVVLLAAVTPSAFAISDYQSGLRHGLADSKINPRVNCPGLTPCHWYILEPGKSFAFHTPEFNRGYVVGYCSISGPHTGFDAEQASWDCDKGPDSWNYEIKDDV